MRERTKMGGYATSAALFDGEGTSTFLETVSGFAMARML